MCEWAIPLKAPQARPGAGATRKAVSDLSDIGLKMSETPPILGCMQPQLLCVEKVCEYCGATLEVSAAEVGDHARMHAYVCPQCGKPDGVSCAGQPHVRVLKPRTDGKTGSYQDTVF